MKEIINLTNIVKKVLIEDEDSRNSLWNLYYSVCKYINPNVMNAKFGTAIKSHSEYGIPPFESVARARRKIVESHPELAGCEEVEGGRWSYEQKFREYAKAGVV